VKEKLSFDYYVQQVAKHTLKLSVKAQWVFIYFVWHINAPVGMVVEVNEYLKRWFSKDFYVLSLGPSSSTTTGLPTTTPIVETCRFTDPDYGVIDLTTLGHTDGTPAYLDKIPSTPDGFSILTLFSQDIWKWYIGSILEYSYNPCKSFSEGPVCQNAAACLCKQKNKLIIINQNNFFANI